MSTATDAPLTLVELYRRWRRVILYGLVLVVAIILILAWLLNRHPADRPVDYGDPVEHFKYGSIGSDVENGLPLEVMRVLPRMFPQHLPKGYEGPKDYRAFGFTYEHGKDVPIGFSIRRRRIDLVGLNCAACHVGQWRINVSETPHIVVGGTSNTVNIEQFFRFLFACAEDERFTEENILAEIEKDGSLFFTDRFLLRLALPAMRAGLLRQRLRLNYIYADGYPGWGHGSVDTFNPYKLMQFAESYPNGVPKDELIAMADYPAVWLQAKKEGIHLHWDGSNSNTRERNLSAAFGAGATRENVDLPRLEQVAAWLDHLKQPPLLAAEQVNKSLLPRGEAVYRQYCFDCHDFAGKEIGQVVDIALIGTDPARLNSFTADFVKAQGVYLRDYPRLKFKHFRKTSGYVNMPLDGIWARAPYLHNGSVPTMWDLLLPHDQRPKQFYRGHGVYDTKKLGIRTDVEKIDGRPAFLHDATKYSKGNQGHSGKEYGTELPDDDKWALIEYLKTL